jgi:hypothetical protein
MVSRILTSAALFLLLLTFACDGERESSAYDLPSAYVDIAPEDLGELRANVFSDLSVDAEFCYDEQEYDVEIRNHGNVSRTLSYAFPRRRPL